MPLKDKVKYNEYMKQYKRCRRFGLILTTNEIHDKYKNGKIYFITCNITNNVYIGSTVQSLILRLNNHKQHNCSSTLILSKNNYRIELIENYACNSKKELLAREQYYIYNRTCINYNKSIHLFLDLLPNNNKETFLLHYEHDKYKHKWITHFKKVIQQFKELTIIPRHIYILKQVLRQMLLDHFQKKILVKRTRTYLITQSYKSILLY